MIRLYSAARRQPADVVSRAALTGLVCGAPIALLSISAFAVAESSVEGDAFSTAVRAALLTREDWEIMPFWLLGAVPVGLVVAAAAAGVWLLVARRAARVRVADVVASLIAAVLASIPTVATARPVALATALIVGVVALVAAPRVTLNRRAGPSRATVASPSAPCAASPAVRSRSSTRPR